jgi:hypothetical protein
VPSFTDRLSDATDQLGSRDLRAYAVVPLLLAALNWNKIHDVLTDPSDFRIGLSFALPVPVTDPWSFVSAPTNGVEVAGGADVVGAAVLAGILVLQGPLLAAYLGGLRHRLADDGLGWAGALRRYWLRLLGFAVVLLAMNLSPALFVVAGIAGNAVPILVLPWLVVLVVLGYLFYAAPYLVVLHDTGLLAALSRSVSLALRNETYLRYAVAYLGTAIVLSIPATLIVTNVPGLGIVLGVVGLAPVGLLFDTTTLLFVADLTDAEGIGYGTDGFDGTVDEDDNEWGSLTRE